MKHTPHPRVKTMDVILAIIGATTVAFIVTMIVTFWHFGAIPDVLCTCYFAAITGECGVMGVIKTAKVRHEDRTWQIEDYERMKEEQNHD